jgi:CBS domain containing-hemolysin-like protein
MTFISILLLAGLTLLAISLQRTYGSLPLKEMKRRARAGDSVAAALYRAASYGSSLRSLLWIVIVIIAAFFFVVLSRATETWFAVLASGGLLWLGFIWLPAQEATRVGIWFASKIAPALDKILQYLHPVFGRIDKFVQKHRPVSFHTGLYDKDDLLHLFERQKVQSDNRVDEQTLEIVEHALQFADKKVSQILTPRRVVKAVSVDDTIGPVLMTDLHTSGHSRFPAYEGKQDNIIGVLYLRDLVRVKAGGSVQKAMSKQVCYVHEDQPLTEALQAILKTHQQLFVVVNSFEEYVGIVTIEDIMEEIVGKQIVDEFDQYDDLRAVAQKLADKEHKEHVVNETPHENIQSVTEVIE